MALQTNGCCALVGLVVYEQQDHVQHAECSRHFVATLALLFAGQLQPSGALSWINRFVLSLIILVLIIMVSCWTAIPHFDQLLGLGLGLGDHALLC